MAFKPPHGALGNAKNNPKNRQRSKMTQTRAETARSTQFFSSLLRGKQVCNYLRQIKCINDWASHEDGTWKLGIPTSVLAIDNNLIPLNTLTGATLRPWVVCIRFQLVPEFLREEVVFIPVLCNSRIGQSRQHERARTGVVSGQNRLPYRERTNVWIRVLLQYLLNCGD